MILPIIAYGDPVLRKKCRKISPGHQGLKELVDNMFETMYQAHGVGLAAPQVGLSIRLFIVDSSELIKLEKEEGGTDEIPVKKVFINPRIMKEDGKNFPYNEGCLSIPEIREPILRKPELKISYMDMSFREHTEEFSGLNARIIQHEHDHIEGILFVDKLNPVRKRLLKKKLDAISRGEVNIHYKMKFPIRKG